MSNVVLSARSNGSTGASASNPRTPATANPKASAPAAISSLDVERHGHSLQGSRVRQRGRIGRTKGSLSARAGLILPQLLTDGEGIRKAVSAITEYRKSDGNSVPLFRALLSDLGSGEHWNSEPTRGLQGPLDRKQPKRSRLVACREDRAGGISRRATPHLVLDEMIARARPRLDCWPRKFNPPEAGRVPPSIHGTAIRSPFRYATLSLSPSFIEAVLEHWLQPNGERMARRLPPIRSAMVRESGHRLRALRKGAFPSPSPFGPWFLPGCDQ